MIQSFSRLPALALTASLLAACGLLEPDPPEAGPQAVAQLVQLRGKVQLERAGQRSDAAPGPLYLKDALETPPEGEASVRFPDGRTLEIGSDARFLIDDGGDGLVLEVARGTVISRVPLKSGPGSSGAVSLQILTPFGLTRVAGGQSEVQITVGPDEAQVSVVVGSVEFLSRNGQPTVVRAGERLALTAGAAEVLGGQPDAKVEAPTRELVLEPIEVVVFASSGRVELKKQAQKRWGAVRRGGDKLQEGDAVRVRRGRSLISLTSGSRVWVERDSEVVFSGSARGDGVEETRLDFKRGAVTLSLTDAQPSRVLLGELSLQSPQGGQFGVAHTREGFEISAVTGEVLVTRGALEQRVRAGQIARVGKEDSARVVAVDRAELVLPSRVGLTVFHPGLATAALSWAGPSERTYRVEVSTDSTFTNLLLAGAVHTNSVNVPLPRRGNLYWRIFLEDGTTRVDQGSAHFAPEPRQAELARLRNEVPESGEKTTIFYQDKAPAVTFTYAQDPAATRYKVVVFRAGELDQPVATRTVTSTQLALEAGALTEGSYVWSATPLAADGEALRGGKMNKLELIYDNSVPNLLVRAPHNGQRVAGSSVQVQGVAPVGSRLLVNGRAIELDDKSRFDARVPVSGPRPQVVFRLTRAQAADVFTVRTLKRAR